MKCALIINAVIRALFDLRLINNSMYGTMYNERGMRNYNIGKKELSHDRYG